MICFPEEKAEELEYGPERASGLQEIPLLRRWSKVSTVPSNKWSPDHKTPVLLLVPQRVFSRGSQGKEGR